MFRADTPHRGGFRKRKNSELLSGSEPGLCTCAVSLLEARHCGRSSVQSMKRAMPRPRRGGAAGAPVGRSEDGRTPEASAEMPQGHTYRGRGHLGLTIGCCGVSLATFKQALRESHKSGSKLASGKSKIQHSSKKESNIRRNDVTIKNIRHLAENSWTCRDAGKPNN